MKPATLPTEFATARPIAAAALLRIAGGSV